MNRRFSEGGCAYEAEAGMVERHFAVSGALAIGLLLLGGCVSSTQYAAISEALKGSPALRRDEIRRCAASVRATPRQKVIMAKVMNLAPGSDPGPVACQRIINATASGKFSYDDYRKVRSGQVTPQTIRILQAR